MKKNKRPIVIICIALALCLIAGIFTMTANSAGRRLAEQLELGQKYLEELNYEQAVVAFEAAIAIDPKCEEAYMGIAEAYLQMGEYGKAMEYAMQGYSQTGGERLLEKAEMIQASADMAAQGGERAAGSVADIPGNSGSQDASEEAAAYGECIVDGIYHHGYTFYDLSDEETALLDELISYTEAGRYEEYAVMLNAEEYVQAWKALADKCGAQSVSNRTAHIAYNGYKICTYGLTSPSYGGGGSYSEGVCLIPAEDGMGALYSWLPIWEDGSYVYIYGSYAYTYCECTDGMFNGALRGQMRSYRSVGAEQWVDERTVEGKVVNGLMDGRFSEYRPANGTYDDVDGDGFIEWYSTFDHGRLTELVEFGEVGNGGVTWRFQEDGTTAGYMEVNRSFEEAKEAVMAEMYYIMPMGYWECWDVTLPAEGYAERRVGAESGACIYPY